jgi:hypothetical protein
MPNRAVPRAASRSRDSAHGLARWARINASSLPLLGEGSARLDPLGLARDLSPGAYFEARPRQGPAIRGRLRPYALTKEDPAQSRRRARRAKYGKRKRTGKRAIEHAKYVFTPLPRAIATTRQVFSVLAWNDRVECTLP